MHTHRVPSSSSADIAAAYAGASAASAAAYGISSMLDMQASHGSRLQQRGGPGSNNFSAGSSGPQMWFPPGNFIMPQAAAAGNCPAAAMSEATSPPWQQAPLVPALASQKASPPGMSFGELEARLRTSWESWAQTNPNEEASSSTSSPGHAGADQQTLAESLRGAQPTTLILANHVAAPEELRPESSVTQPRPMIPRGTLKVFRAEGLFCPDCRSRSSCSFHCGDGWPCTKPELLKAPLAVDEGGGKSEDMEDSSTEAGSSEPWYNGSGSDGWSDSGDWSSTHLRLDSSSAAGSPLAADRGDRSSRRLHPSALSENR